MKLGGRVQHGPRRNPLFFRVGPNYSWDTFFRIGLFWGDGAFGLSGINAIHLESSKVQ